MTKNNFDFIFSDFKDKYEANVGYQNNTNKSFDQSIKEIEKDIVDIQQNYCLQQTLDLTVRKYTLQSEFDELNKKSKDFVLHRQVLSKFEKVNIAILQMNTASESFVDGSFVDDKVSDLRKELNEFKKLP